MAFWSRDKSALKISNNSETQTQSFLRNVWHRFINVLVQKSLTTSLFVPCHTLQQVKRQRGLWINTQLLLCLLVRLRLINSMYNYRRVIWGQGLTKRGIMALWKGVDEEKKPICPVYLQSHAVLGIVISFLKYMYRYLSALKAESENSVTLNALLSEITNNILSLSGFYTWVQCIRKSSK